MAKLKMNFSQNPEVYIKKQARIRNQRPRIYKVHNHLFLNFFKVENLLHCVVIEVDSTQQQLGNGLVKLRNNNYKFIPYTHSTNKAKGVSDAILSKRFRDFWKFFMVSQFGDGRLNMS